MKYKLIKQKAVFQIFLVISLSFYTSFIFSDFNNQGETSSKVNYFDLISQDIFPEVNAQGVEKVCCEKTTQTSEYNGESCVYTEEINCDPNSQKSAVSCLQTDFCGAGVCILNGVCQDSVEKGKCLEKKGIYKEGKSEDIAQCKVACCDLPSGASLTTESQCRGLVEQFPDIRFQDSWKQDITDQVTCSQQSRSAEQGCCVKSDSCSFGSRKDCQEGEFKLNNLCSNPNLGCPVTAKHSTTCYENKVYWQDSAGNLENVYDGKFDASWAYSNWLVVEPNTITKVNPQTIQDVAKSGNCQFSLGTTCGEIQDGTKTYLRNNGVQENNLNKIQNQCISLNCLSTIKNPKISWMDGRARQNGESWCEYPSKTGNGEDLVGSRHFLHRCEAGVEIVEECRERRKTICVQNDVPKNLIDPNLQNDYTQAKCAPNNWQLCLGANEETESCGLTLSEVRINYTSTYGGGGPCYDLRNDNGQYNSCVMKTMCKKLTCESEISANCYFNKEVGLCAPSVPPGTLGKESDFTELSNGEKLGFEFETKMYFFEQTSLAGNPEWNDEDCVAGCDQHTSAFANKWNGLCTSLGDLGAKYNVAGDYNKNGFYHGGPFSPNNIDDLDDSANAQGVTNTKQFSYYTSGIKPLTGNIYALAEALENVISMKKEQLQNSDFVPGFFADVGGWVSSTVVVGAGVGVAALLGIFSVALVPAVGGYVAATSAAGIAGLAAGKTAIGTTGLLGGASVVVVAGIIIAAIIVVYVLLEWLFRAEKGDLTYKISCGPWTPPSGGKNCKLCNDKSKFPTCDEYLCKSLGKSCIVLNSNSPGNETCVNNQRSTIEPIIAPYIISPFTENDIEKIPPSTGFTGGYKFKKNITAFTNVQVGIKILDKAKNNALEEGFAECKISRKSDFNYKTDNAQFFEDSLSRSTHTKKIIVSQSPIQRGEDRIELEAGKVNTFYIKCKSSFGDENNPIINLKPYFIEIPVSKGPDTSPPEIKSFSIKNNAPLPYNLNQTLLSIYVEDQTGLENATSNKLSGKDGGCKYSTADQDYEIMPFDMSCTINKVNPEGQYRCTTLLSLKPNQDNAFYFRCKDLAKDVNGNSKPQVSPSSMPPIEEDSTVGYHLIATQQLKILESGPSGNVSTTDVNLTVKTEIGAESGKSSCYYSGGLKSQVTRDLTFSPSGIKFSNTNSEEHSTKLSLQNEKDYIYYVWCRDVAGNEAKTKVEFHTTTPDLILEDVQPDEQTFYTDKIQLKTTTSGGIKGDGDSTCTYQGGLPLGYFNEDKLVLDGKTIQTKNLTLTSSGVKYYLNVTCSDQYKTVKKQISFTVNYASYPQIIRIYKTQTFLNLLLDNPAECRYSSDNPNFEYDKATSTVMASSQGGFSQQSQISSSTIYIKCKDTRTGRFGPPSGSYTVYP